MLLGSEEETRALGRKLGALLQPFDFVALYGELGAGKTLFVKAVAEGAGAPGASSPTFALVNQYQGRLKLQHLDLYRLSGAADLGVGDLQACGCRHGLADVLGRCRDAGDLRPSHSGDVRRRRPSRCARGP